MKKKLVAVILATSMAFSFTACGSPAPAKSEDAKTEGTAPQKAEEKEPEDTTKSAKVEQINLDNADGTLVYSRHEVTTNYNGATAVRIYFNYTNKSDETKTAQSTFYPQVFQNGIECEFTMGNLEESNEASNNLSKELQKGTTLEVAFVYALQDDANPVTLKVNDQSSENLVKGVYQEQELALK